MLWKDVEVVMAFCIVAYYPRIFLDGLRKTTKILIKNNCVPTGVRTGNLLTAVCYLNQLARCDKIDNKHDCFMCYRHHCVYRKLHAWWRCPPYPITLSTILYALLTSVALSDVCICEIFKEICMYAVKVSRYICNLTVMCFQKHFYFFILQYITYITKTGSTDNKVCY